MAQSKMKQVTFTNNSITLEQNDENTKLKETILNLEKKLKRKQNENQNLLDNIEQVTKEEFERVTELYELKEAFQNQKNEMEKLSDELAIKTKEELDNLKLNDLQDELKETKKALKKSTDEMWLLKEKINSETDTKRIKEKEKSRIEAQNNKFNQEIQSQLQEIEQLNGLLTRGDEIIKSKEREITSLHKRLQQDKEVIKSKEGEFINLKSLMSEENETVHQIEQEVTRLLKIIAQDQRIIVQKDEDINYLKKCLNDIHISTDDTKNENDNETKLQKLNAEVVDMKKQLTEKDEQIAQLQKSLYHQENILTTFESLKVKIKESMLTIEQKSQEIQRLQENASSDKNVEEMNNLRKDLEDKIKKLELLTNKIQTKDIMIEKFETEQRNMKAHIERLNVENLEVQSYQEQINKELLILKDESNKLVKGNDEKIKCLEAEITKERQVGAHVQFTQEREILEKEREIEMLNTILAQERKVLRDNEQKIQQELINSEPPPPPRPPRTKSMLIMGSNELPLLVCSLGTKEIY